MARVRVNLGCNEHVGEPISVADVMPLAIGERALSAPALDQNEAPECG
jgi:hypothetical protein